MDIRLLKTFLLVARLLNVTKAAEQLSFTQPAITSQIYSLEAELQVRLFERRGKRLTLTAAGEKLIEYAEKLTSLYEETQNVMSTFTQKDDIIKLGVSTQLINHFLPALLLTLQEQIPRLNINVEICMNTPEVLKGITEHRFDLGFIHGENSYPQIRQHGIRNEDVLWVASRNFINSHAPITDIRQVPLIHFTEGSVLRTKLDSIIPASELQSPVQYSDSEAIKQAVIAGLGISYLPRSLVSDELSRGLLAIIESGPPMQLRISLVHRKDKSYTLPMYALLVALSNQPGSDESLKELLTS